MKPKKTGPEVDFEAQAESIAEFRKACERARKILGPIDAYNETQKRVILGDAVKCLNVAGLPYYSRAINLLLGEDDHSNTKMAVETDMEDTKRKIAAMVIAIRAEQQKPTKHWWQFWR